MKRGKKYLEAAKSIDRATLYDPAEAIGLAKKAAVAKFDETIEVHIRTGCDGRHADQQIRGAVVLPHGTGKAVKVLASEGIRTNVTLIFSPLQALLAARAGASFVSPFLGRLDDIGNPGIEIVTQIAEMFALHGIDTEIISASVRNPMHVLDSAMAGSHIATIPYNVILQMVKHPLTDAGMKKFIEDYNKAFNK